jgi:hypothetical protein
VAAEESVEKLKVVRCKGKGKWPALASVAVAMKIIATHARVYWARGLFFS